MARGSMRDVTRDHIRKGNQAVENLHCESANIAGKEYDSRCPAEFTESRFEAQKNDDRCKGPQIRIDGEIGDGGRGKSSPLQDLHSVNMEISRTMAQLDTAVIRAHKLGFSGHLPGTEIRKFSSALREVQDLLQVMLNHDDWKRSITVDDVTSQDWSSFFEAASRRSVFTPKPVPAMRHWAQENEILLGELSLESPAGNASEPLQLPAGSFSPSLYPAGSNGAPPSPEPTSFCDPDPEPEAGSSPLLHSPYISYLSPGESLVALDLAMTPDAASNFSEPQMSALKSATWHGQSRSRLEGDTWRAEEEGARDISPSSPAPPEAGQVVPGEEYLGAEKGSCAEGYETPEGTAAPFKEFGSSPSLPTPAMTSPPHTVKVLRRTSAHSPPSPRLETDTPLSFAFTPLMFLPEITAKYPDAFGRWGGERTPLTNTLETPPLMLASPPATCQQMRPKGESGGGSFLETSDTDSAPPSPFRTPGIELRREGFFSASPAPSSADPAAFMDSPLGFAAWKRSAGPNHLQALPTAMWRDQELPAGESPDPPTPTMNSPPLTTDLSQEVAHFFSQKDGGGGVGGVLVTPVGGSEEGRGMRGGGGDSWQEGGQWVSELHGRGGWRIPEGEEACRDADGGHVGAGGIDSWHGGDTREDEVRAEAVTPGGCGTWDVARKVPVRLDLASFPTMFQKGEGGKQLEAVWAIFGDGTHDDASPPGGMGGVLRQPHRRTLDEVERNVPSFGSERVGLLLGLLTSRGLLKCQVVNNQWCWHTPWL